MDPDETLKLLDEAIDDGDYGAMKEHADDLIEWLMKLGFVPGLQSDWRSALSRHAFIEYLKDLKRVARNI